jgi:NADH-quinone oxidoreductase subunit M
MNFLSIFVLIPLLMLLGLWISRNLAQVRTVMVVGASALLISAITLTVYYLQER